MFKSSDEMARAKSNRYTLHLLNEGVTPETAFRASASPDELTPQRPLPF